MTSGSHLREDVGAEVLGILQSVIDTVVEVVDNVKSEIPDDAWVRFSATTLDHIIVIDSD